MQRLWHFLQIDNPVKCTKYIMANFYWSTERRATGSMQHCSIKYVALILLLNEYPPPTILLMDLISIKWKFAVRTRFVLFIRQPVSVRLWDERTRGSVSGWACMNERKHTGCTKQQGIFCCTYCCVFLCVCIAHGHIYAQRVRQQWRISDAKIDGTYFRNQRIYYACYTS